MAHETIQSKWAAVRFNKNTPAVLADQGVFAPGLPVLADSCHHEFAVLGGNQAGDFHPFQLRHRVAGDLGKLLVAVEDSARRAFHDAFKSYGGKHRHSRRSFPQGRLRSLALRDVADDRPHSAGLAGVVAEQNCAYFHWHDRAILAAIFLFVDFGMPQREELFGNKLRFPRVPLGRR